MSGTSIRLTLWGNQAQNFIHADSPVVGIKGVRVGDFGGKSLSTTFDSFMQVNPDIPEAHTLRGWYDAGGKEGQFSTFSGNGGFSSSTKKTIKQSSDEQLGMGEKVSQYFIQPDYFTLDAAITHIRKENFCYPACNNEGCNKKVTELSNGWQCEKCDSTFASPSYRLNLISS